MPFIKFTWPERVFQYFNYIFMICFALITLYPLMYVFFASVSRPELFVGHSGLLLRPLGFTIGGYQLVFQNPMLLRAYGNTILYMTVGTILNLIMTTIGAFVLSRRDFKLKVPIMMMIVFTMFFSGGLIPTYLLVMGLGLGNTMWALILPSAISSFNLIIMRTYFLNIPSTYEEAARIDGANDVVILVRIILPLCMPIVAVMILFYGVGHWNSWFSAMIYLRSREMFPLQLILREILILADTRNMLIGVEAGIDQEPIAEIIRYATIMVATVPILFVYPFLQKYFVKGIMLGGVKG